MTDAPLLQVRDLSIDFGTPRGRLHALRGINVDVPKGRIMGLVGESGCGKSTLAYALSGLLAGNGQVTGGAILMDGQDVTKMSDRQLRDMRGQRVSMIFQDPMTALNPVITIGRQMLDIQYRDPGTSAEKRARAAAMLDRVGIPDAAAQLGSYPHQFSGGMRQRVCIAMALLTKPDLLIADEPTTALDATLEVQIIELLRELQQEIGCAIVFVSHHLGTVAELCDDVTVMYAGEVVEQGDVRSVFHAPAHPYTQALLECDPARIKEATRHLPTIAGTLPDLVNVPEGCIFAPRCAHAWDRCRAEHPAARRASAHHTAACHLLDTEART
ncbi:peptide ABC transporter ATP-binding protein [Pelagivirga sediminicola]|uniref:Peptide ABC transporter ATP-binding protein n=1 Tax=Pelagivirga sediminicola TaxID=2170575 RepID=A0A2T7GAB2_9RHOB|nr:ABC transporter ATP-binding protein [Pelagivirga sediminicola]PVA11336.1 peptide ABC transporter ATP-binding protein [Pelagivirga sediminicola]